MKIKTWIKYEESYIPPRCRKLRYNEREEYINIELAEASKEQLKLAFVVDEYNRDGHIYAYGGKLWRKAITRDIACDDEKTPLSALKYWHEHSSQYFYRDWYDHTKNDRQSIIDTAQSDMQKYLLVGRTLYIQTEEPMYCIYTFGLGHNHGGTSLSVDYHYNCNISHTRYYSALDGVKAVKEAKRIALGRGDTDYVKYIRKKIKVYMPELVRIKPAQEHGDGDEFINSLEQIINNSDTATEAGLLCIAMTSALSA